jgi:hypothetical protein
LLIRTSSIVPPPDAAQSKPGPPPPLGVNPPICMTVLPLPAVAVEVVDATMAPSM